MTIYIGNLPYEVSDVDVEDVFKEYGAVKSVYLPTDRETGKMRGFGFVEMEDETKEQDAIEALNEADWMGRQLRVNKARPRPDKGGRR
ncbi:MAG: RNA-binding protein [Oscillatoria sp. SIO1A7]|nr:RNA-binding protein [Oscillatoria sp. SIO1A7]